MAINNFLTTILFQNLLKASQEEENIGKKISCQNVGQIKSTPLSQKRRGCTISK